MKLHLGCGKRYFPGWVHVDIASFDHIDVKTSVDDLSMFASETIEIIYSSHTFEYFDRVEAVKVLQEWNRVLKPGGTIRLAVPDFEQLIKVYHKTGDLNKIIGPLYGRMQIGTDAEPNWIFHKTVYDYETISSLLVENGFTEVSHYDWRSTDHAHIDDHSQAYFPHMEKDTGVLVSLNVEAIKCSTNS